MSEKYSFEKINYMLRPRKQIERKIFIDIFNKIQQKQHEINLRDYRYIGMGSVFYYDFILFHKNLHINKMTSIDNSLLKRRFDFNKPYNFVEFENMASTEFLGQYSKEDKIILWLDYDKGIYNEKLFFINDIILDDLQLITEKATRKDFFIITLDVKLPRDVEEKEDEDGIKELSEKSLKILESIHPYLTPELNNIKSITPKRFPVAVQRAVLNIITDKIKFKTGLNFYKLFAFLYNDGTPMLTIGGVFDENDQMQQMIKNDPFISIRDEIVDIDVPILTYKEKLYLDQKIKSQYVEKNLMILN